MAVNGGAGLDWRGKGYSFFCNRECEYFPCHADCDEDSFNCLFCFCPLYFLGSDCGGAFKYSAEGIKDCEACTLPHNRENYGMIIKRLKEAMEGDERA